MFTFTKERRRKNKMKIMQQVAAHCLYRLPSVGIQLIECSVCKVWYHANQLISILVLGMYDYWFIPCVACLQRLTGSLSWLQNVRYATFNSQQHDQWSQCSSTQVAMGGHINIVYLESHQDQILHQDYPSVTAISWQIVLIVDPVLYIDYSQYCSGLYHTLLLLIIPHNTYILSSGDSCYIYRERE